MSSTPSAPLTSSAPVEPLSEQPDVAVLPPGKPPAGIGLSPLLAQLIALALILLGAAGIQNLLVSRGVLHGSSWLSSAIGSADGIEGGSAAVTVIGVAAIVLGVLLLPVVVRRRPRTTLTLSARTGVHIRVSDLSRIADTALDGADALSAVHVRAGRRRIRVRATTLAGRDRNPEITTDLDRRLIEAFTAIDRKPRISITIRNEAA